MELTGNWDDDSTFLYRNAASDLEVRVERFPIGAAAKTEGLLDKIEERVKMLGPLKKATRGKVDLAGVEGGTLSVECKRVEDKETSLMEVLVFKSGAATAVSITALAPLKQQSALASAWRQILAKTRIVEVQ